MRNHHIADFPLAVDSIVHENNFSNCAVGRARYTASIFAFDDPMSAPCTLHETDPIGGVALRLYRLEHLVRQANHLNRIQQQCI